MHPFRQTGMFVCCVALIYIFLLPPLVTIFCTSLPFCSRRHIYFDKERKSVCLSLSVDTRTYLTLHIVQHHERIPQCSLKQYSIWLGWSVWLPVSQLTLAPFLPPLAVSFHRSLSPKTATSNTITDQWCEQQETSCPLICLQLPNGTASTESNTCDPVGSSLLDWQWLIFC